MLPKIKFQITTPEKIAFQDEVEAVSLPTENGEITILAHHIPLVTNLVPGEIIIKKDMEKTSLAVSGGLVQVNAASEVLVLADTAEHALEIDLQRAEEARLRAQEMLQEKKEDAEDYALLSAKLQKELVRLKVAKKHHSKKINLDD